MPGVEDNSRLEALSTPLNLLGSETKNVNHIPLSGKEEIPFRRTPRRSFPGYFRLKPHESQRK